MKSDYAGVMWTCDGCRKSRIQGENEDHPVGVYGHMFEVTGPAGAAGNHYDFYACTPRCVAAAIRATRGDPYTES